MRTRVFGLLLLLVSTGAFAQTGFGGGPGGRQSQTGELTGTAQISERTFTTTVGGRLQPANTVSHSAPVSGIVSSVRIVVGQRVEPGDILYTIVRDDSAAGYAPVPVTARIAGVVASVSVRPDNEVRSGESGVSLITTGEYVRTATISDKDAFAVSVGASVAGHDDSGSTIRGTLVARSPEPDYQTGLFTLAFRFRGGGAAFPGQFVTVDLPVETVEGIFIPQSLLVRRYGRYYVWVVTQDNTLTSREVTAGRTHGDDVQITSGLTLDDRILLRRRGNEQEGTSVGAAEE